MNTIRKHFFKITAFYILLNCVVFLFIIKNGATYLFISIAIYLLVSIFVFKGNFVGIMGIIYQLITKKEPVKFYETAYKLGATNPSILASYCLSLLRNYESKKALEVAKKGLEHSNYYLVTKALMTNMGLAYWQLGEIDKAIEIYLDIFKKFRTDDSNPNYLELEADDFVEKYSFVLEQDFTTLGFFYIIKKDFEKATFYTKAAIQKNSSFASAYDNLGQIYYYKGEIKRAREMFEKALSFNPHLIDSLYFLSIICYHNDEFQQAKSYLDRINPMIINGLNFITKEQLEDLSNKINKKINVTRRNNG